MPTKKKKFIDNKNAQKFQLVHRSQRDPLIATDAGERVLAPIQEDPTKRHEEQHKFGIFYDDEYNYLQHLKDVNEIYQLEEPLEERFRVSKNGLSVDAGRDLVLSSLSLNDPSTDDTQQPSTSTSEPKLTLPSSVLGTSGVELVTGLLNQAAPAPGPHPELDPEIVAALEDDDLEIEEGNELADDFILEANAPPDGEEEEYAEEENEGSNEEEDDSASSTGVMGREGEDDDMEDFIEEETRTRFTKYSVTSSVMRRSKGLQLIDDMFEKAYENYDEDQMGGLDFEAEEEEVIGGFLEPDSDRLMALVEEYQDGIQEQKQALSRLMEENEEKGKERILQRVEEEGEGDGGEELETLLVESEQKNEDKWDCETILSTYSTLYNHPTLIKEPEIPKRKRRKIEIDVKTGLPKEFNDNRGKKLLLPSDDSMEVESEMSGRSKASTFRPKGETPEERKKRKREVKMERKERRIEKKANKMAFKGEEKRQNVEKLNQKQNCVGMKLL